MNKIFTNDNSILRVLDTKENQIFIIDCLNKTMPKWVPASILDGFKECDVETLYHETGFDSTRQLTPDEQRISHERFTMIAPILPFIADRNKRNLMIDTLSTNVSKQTLRKYLCQYLIFQSVLSLAPPPKDNERPLTADEKNFRWALNKFYYTPKKDTLQNTYTLMLKEKYTDSDGKLLPKYPSYYQFRYYYRQHRKLQTQFISRDGLKDYQRNNRCLLGNGVQQYCPSIGYGMLDATVCDIYLINESGDVIGRPTLTSCIDGYSGLCLGYCITLEGGSYSLRALMQNIIADKVSHCKKHGVFITSREWNTNVGQLPATFITDQGQEYCSDLFAQLTELGIKIVNLPPFRPELKAPVERFFQHIQHSYKNLLKGKGVIEPNFNERGGHDYRKDACLTLEDFEKIILHCIIYYNSKRVLKNFPYTEKMLAAGIKPYCNEIFEYEKMQLGSNFIDVDEKTLALVMLPRCKGKFTRKGLVVKGLRYKNNDYIEDFLKGGECVVATNPDDVSTIWLLSKGKYIAFDLIEKVYDGKSIADVRNMQDCKNQLVKDCYEENLQAKIDLAERIQLIAQQTQHSDVHLKNIRTSRQKEITRRHIDFTKVGTTNE